MSKRARAHHDTSLGLFDEGFVASACGTRGTAALRLRALAENPGARSRAGLRHGLLGFFSAGMIVGRTFEPGTYEVSVVAAPGTQSGTLRIWLNPASVPTWPTEPP